MATKIKTRKIKLAPYDSADYLKTDADIKKYLETIIRRAYSLTVMTVQIVKKTTALRSSMIKPLAIGGFATMKLLNAAYAETPTDAAPSITVKYSDLDLNTDRG
jgi:hypothetical protein